MRERESHSGKNPTCFFLSFLAGEILLDRHVYIFENTSLNSQLISVFVWLYTAKYAVVKSIDGSINISDLY